MSLKISNAACPIGEKYETLLQVKGSRFDRIVTKTCTLQEIPKPENPTWRYSNTYSINNYGLGNQGYGVYANYSFSGKPYVISVAGSYKELLCIVGQETNANYLEINVSCPNSAKSIVSMEALVSVPFQIPFGLKLPPYFEPKKIREVAVKLNKIKTSHPKLFSYIVCCNTIPIERGGVGGRVLKSIARYNIGYFKKYLPNIEIWGCGGIRTVADIEEYEIAGCHGVQMATIIMEKGMKYVDDLIREYRG